MNIEHNITITYPDGEVFNFSDEIWHMALVYVENTSKLATEDKCLSLKVIMVKTIRDMFHLTLRDARVLYEAVEQDLNS